MIVEDQGIFLTIHSPWHSEGFPKSPQSALCTVVVLAGIRESSERSAPLAQKRGST